MTTKNLLFPIQYSQLFSDPAPELCELFKFFTKEELVKFAFNLTNNPRYLTGWKNLCSDIFASSGDKKAVELIYTKLQPSQFGSHSLSGQHTGVELQRQIFSCNSFATALDIPDEKKEWSLFLIVLIVNDIISLPLDTESIAPNDDYAVAYAGILTSLPCEDLLNFHPNSLLIHAYKAQQLLYFCSKHPSLSALVDEFCKEHSCSCINEYLHFMGDIFTRIFSGGMQGFCKLTTYSEEKNIQEFYNKKFRSLAFPISETISLSNNTDYKFFRAKPIVEICDSEYLVLCPTFLVNCLYNSIKFSLAGIAKQKRIKVDVNRILTLEFTEHKLLYALLKDSVYPAAKHVTGKKCDEEKIDGAPDYYIRNGADIFLFELKDYRLAAELRETPNKAAIDDYITNRLVDKGNNKNGAVLQLISNISLICKDKFLPDSNIKRIKNIYPILVFGEASFVSNGISNLLNKEFKAALSNISIPGNINIHDLLVVDIDCLIQFYNLLTSKKVKLKQLIKEYDSFINHKTKLKSIVEVLHTLTISFSTFLRYYMDNYSEGFDPTKIRI